MLSMLLEEIIINNGLPVIYDYNYDDPSEF